MELSYNKIIKAKLALSGLDSSYLAKQIGVNRASLSRNESKNFHEKVCHFFDEYDDEINEALDLIIEHFEIDEGEFELSSNISEDPKANYSTDKKKLITLKKQLQELKRDKRYLQKQVDISERNYLDKCKEVSKLEMELSEANRPNKQTG